MTDDHFQRRRRQGGNRSGHTVSIDNGVWDDVEALVKFGLYASVSHLTEEALKRQVATDRARIAGQAGQTREQATTL